MQYAVLPMEGRTYTVRDVIPAHDYNGGRQIDTIALLLVEVKNPPNARGTENGFAAWRFRRPEEVAQMQEIEEPAYA